MKEELNIEDRELLDRYYASGDNHWLGILLERYTTLLLGVCMKYLKNEDDATDGVQQVFYKVIADLHKYKVEHFKSWIYMVAKNHCLMKLRGGRNYNVEVDEKIRSTHEEDKIELLRKENRLDLLAAAMLELSPDQQQCITLFYLHKKSYQQISEETGFPVMQVKSNIQNGKRNLRIKLERKEKDD